MLPVLVLAGGIRAQELSTLGVSFDESFTQRMVEFSWPEMFERIGRETQPPLFYAVLKVWSAAVGGSVVAGRVLTTLFGVASVAGIYAFVRRAYDRPGRDDRERFREAELPALVAATLLAIAPLQIFWSQQIRMYSLPIALSVWSSYFLVRAVREPSFRRGWPAYTAAAVLLAYSHYFGLFVLAAQFVYAFGFRLAVGRGRWSTRVMPAVLSGCFVWFAWQPWLAVFLRQRDGVGKDFYLPGPSWSTLGSTMHELWVGVGVPLSSGRGLVIAEASFLVFAVLMLGRRPADALLALSSVTPVAAAFAVSAVSQPVIAARYFLFGHVFLLAAIAVVASRVPGQGRYVAVGLVLTVLAFPCLEYLRWRAEAARLPGMRAAVERIESARGAAPVVVSNPMLFTSALTYLRQRNRVFNFRPPHGFPMYQGTPVMREADYIDESGLLGLAAGELVTLDADASMGRVPVPPGWRLVREERFKEWFAELVVRLYIRAEAGEWSGVARAK